jgi:Zn-dependent protease with chaperone function
VIEFSAVYYDGKTSAHTPVRVDGLAQSLRIVGADVNIEVALADVRPDTRVGNARRTLDLPGGAQLRTDDHAALATLFPRANRVEAWVQTLEQRWGYALAAIAVIAGFSAWCFVYGLPLAAKVAAGFVPIAIEAKLGEHTLAALDNSLCAPTALAAGRTQALRKSFSTLTAGLDDGYAYRLEFRTCTGIGPNAFALPGGTIVVIDDLVKLAENDQQIAAVLAHEIGHVRRRHGLRMALQGAGVAALIAALAGDAVTITKLAVMLPTVLLQSGYSRDFETEADTYAFQRMQAVGLSPQYFADIMQLMEKQRDRRAGTTDKKKAGTPPDATRTLDYLSTHPATAERIQRAREYR